MYTLPRQSYDSLPSFKERLKAVTAVNEPHSIAQPRRAVRGL